MSEGETAQNMDREIWREIPGEHYCDSAFATPSGGIGFNCGGHCIVQTPREWQALYRAADPAAHLARVKRMEEAATRAADAMERHLAVAQKGMYVAQYYRDSLAELRAALADSPGKEDGKHG